MCVFACSDRISCSISFTANGSLVFNRRVRDIYDRKWSILYFNFHTWMIPFVYFNFDTVRFFTIGSILRFTRLKILPTETYPILGYCINIFLNTTENKFVIHQRCWAFTITVIISVSLYNLHLIFKTLQFAWKRNHYYHYYYCLA